MAVIKFHKVPELFPNRKVRTVRAEQLWNSIIIGWTKNEATLHFAGYLENYTEDIYMIFADIKASVY